MLNSPKFHANHRISCSSRLDRDRHASLERRLVNLTQSVASLSIPQYSETTGNNAGEASANDSGCASSHKEDLQLLRSEDMDSSRLWREHPWVKRTLRKESSVMSFFLGTMRTKSRTNLQLRRNGDELEACCVQDQDEHETAYTIYPAQWMIRLGIRYGLHLKLCSSSTQGWQNSLKTFNPVPDDALIFEYCEKGNISAVRGLLSRGLASVKDTNSDGYTPLHVSLYDDAEAA